MVQIKVLGSGCANCRRTTAIIADAIHEYHLDAQVVEVHDMADIMAYGVMSTPAVVMNEKVVLTGRIPAKGTVVELVRQASAH